MNQVTVTRVVAAPPTAVFDLLLDSRNDERWCPLASSYELLEGPPGVGALYRFTQRSGPGRSTTMHVRTTVAERPVRLEWDDDGRGGPAYHSTVELTPHPRGTHVRQTNQLEFPGRAEQLVWFVGAQLVLRVQLRNLARVLGEG